MEMMQVPIKYDVYLAGSMHGRLGKECLEERSKAKLACKVNGLTYYDPAEDEDVPPNKIIDLKPNLRRMRWYVSKDDYNIDRCRAVLVLTGDISSSGTMWEMGRMYYKCNRPVYIISPKMYHHTLTNFTTVKATKIFENVEQACKWIRRNK
jgi:nucleoside 2-deoxyribosyltransferase